MRLPTVSVIALDAIRQHALRSVLTGLGVVIGVWSVVTMLTLGNATARAVTGQIQALGSNMLSISVGRGLGRGGGAASPRLFRASDVDAVASEVGGVERVVPRVAAQRTAVLNAANWQTSVTGTTSDYLDVQRWGLAEGRRFSEDEEVAGRMVCLLGDTVRQKLQPARPVVGEVLRLGNVGCTIVGVLAPKGQGFGANPDDTVLLPIRAAQRNLTGSRDVHELVVSYSPLFDAAQVKADVIRLLRERRGIGPEKDDDFSVFDARQIAQTVSSTTTLLTALLAAIGAVSLVVGGIGIMNIMLVSVTERTREIGIRLAIGALGTDVLRQFLVEAVLLSCLGGLLGVVLAGITAAMAAPAIGVAYRFEPGTNALAFGLSALIGVLFGWLPARRAANLNPIEALRHE